MLNAPTLAGVALLLMMLSSPSRKKPKSECNRCHYTPTKEEGIFIDNPINTNQRNDAQGNNPREIRAYLSNVFTTEAALHPGVRRVAGWVGA